MDIHLIVPACALAVQVISVVLTIRLWRHTGSRALSILLLLIVSLMAFRRAVSLARFLVNGEMRVDLIAETIALMISSLILLAILYIGRILSRDRTSQDALVSAEARYRTLFNQSPDGVLLIDSRGTIVEFNDETCRQLGYTREEFKNLRIADLDPVESPEEIRETFEKAAREGKAEFEVKHKTKNNEIRDVLVTTQTVQMAGEMFHHTIWRDITERKRTEELLLRSEERFRIAIAANRQGWYDLNLRTGESVISDEYARILGYDPGEFRTNLREWMNSLEPDDRAAAEKSLDEAAVTGGIRRLEFRRRTKTGELKWIRLTGKVVEFDEEKKPLRMIGTLTDISHQKRAEHALAESEADYRTLFESSTDGIFILGLDGTFIDANRTAYERLGYSRDEFLGMHISMLDHPDYAKDVPARLRQIREQGAAVFESGHLRKDGSLMPVEVNSRILEYKGKQVFFSVVRDVSERKQAEAALRESERRYRTLFDQSPDGILLLAMDGRILEFNESAHRDLGYTREEFAKLSIADLDPDENPDDVKARMKKILQDGKASFSVKHRTKQGELRDVHVIIHVITLSGSPVAHAIWHDITERKQAEEKIRQSEQFIRGILDTVDEGFIVIDRQFRILTANRAYCEQAGEACDAIIGKYCYEVSHRAGSPCYETGEDCAPRHVFETGKPYSALHKHRDAKGMIMYVETKGFPIRDASGEVVSVIETINNITEKHLLEEERLKTQKLESIGTLAGGIAHDFNNLLQGIFGYLSMAKMTLDEKEKAQTMLEQAEKALHQSVNLTTQLLTFSKGGKPVKKTISLIPVIENAVKFALSGSRSTYQLRVAPDLRQVEADEGQLGQVIQNIVLNADQAMPLSGNVVIEARNLPSSDPSLPLEFNGRDAVLISIEDTGVGIPEQYLGKIFDPYFTTKEKGSGLGLATSYSIISNHGGLVRVKSTVGKGTTFFLYLPASEKSAQTAAGPAVQGARGTGRVLVMDDEEVIRLVAGEMLGALGHEVVFADKGETAVELFQSARAANRPFDVVILDLTIRGGMGGAETLQQLRAIDPEVKAIVSSGYSDDSITAGYREQGFRAFLKKPYNVDELQEALNRLLNG